MRRCVRQQKAYLRAVESCGVARASAVPSLPRARKYTVPEGRSHLWLNLGATQGFFLMRRARGSCCAPNRPPLLTSPGLSQALAATDKGQDWHRWIFLAAPCLPDPTQVHEREMCVSEAFPGEQRSVCPTWIAEADATTLVPDLVDYLKVD